MGSVERITRNKKWDFNMWTMEIRWFLVIVYSGEATAEEFFSDAWTHESHIL